jgi:DNA-binding transcriptional LysR family regulator
VSYAYASSTILELLYKNDIELAVIDCDVPVNLVTQKIFEDEYVLLCSEAFADALPDPISAEEMQNIDLILPSTPNSVHRPVFNWIKENKLDHNIILYTASSIPWRR